MPNDFETSAGGVHSFIPAEADALLQALSETEHEWSIGGALYDMGGMFNDNAESKWAVTALQIRDAMAQAGKKATEEHIKQLTYGDPAYKTYVEENTRDRARWIELNAARKRIEMRLKILTYGSAR